MTILAVNDAPDCTPALSSGDEETPQTGTVSCIDVEGDDVTYVMGTAPAKGTMNTFDTATGDWTYTPLINRTGAVAFTFRATDGTLISTPATVSITLVDVNDPPVAKNDTKPFTATSTTTIVVTSNDFSGPAVSGVTSEPGDTVNVTAATGATKGILTIAANGKGVVYDPRGCATGDDAFSYEITDGHGATAHASVFVTIARPGTNGLSKKPITDTPALAFVTGSTFGSTTPMRLSWCGATSGAAGQGLPGRPEHQRRVLVQEPAQGDEGHLHDPEPRALDALSLARPDDRHEGPQQRLPHLARLSPRPDRGRQLRDHVHRRLADALDLERVGRHGASSLALPATRRR